MAPHTHIPAPRNTIETYSSRPEREPTRNEKGEIICTHEQCAGKSEIFRRPCEWNKHMDKHERPYKCSEPTCEQNPGFTYSGGLLRHMREVHKKGVGPTREPLYCPHQNCIRSTGEGFTRKENLEEHLRRRHAQNGVNGGYSPPPQSASPSGSKGDEDEHTRKRRRTTEPEISSIYPDLQDAQIITDPSAQYQVQPPIRAYGDGVEGTSPIDSTTDSQIDQLSHEEAIEQLKLARRQRDEARHEIARLQRLNLEHNAFSNPPPQADAPQPDVQAQLEHSAIKANGIINGLEHAGVRPMTTPETRRISIQNDLLVEHPQAKNS